MIRVKVNGQNREFVQPMGLMEFLSANGLDIRFIAVAHNGEVVDKKNQDKLTINIREFNYYVNNDKRIENLIIPIGDGLNICRKL